MVNYLEYEDLVEGHEYQVFYARASFSGKLTRIYRSKYLGGNVIVIRSYKPSYFSEGAFISNPSSYKYKPYTKLHRVLNE